MKFLRKISKISFEKAKNALFWSIFKKFQLFFLKFIRKIEFVSIFGKVAKNRPFGKNISFPQQFFNFYRVGGGEVPCVPPGGAYEIALCTSSIFQIYQIKHMHWPTLIFMLAACKDQKADAS